MTYEERNQHDKLLTRYEPSNGVEHTDMPPDEQEKNGWEIRMALVAYWVGQLINNRLNRKV